MHINFDNDEIEVQPTFDPKKKVQSQAVEEESKDNLNFDSLESKEEKEENLDEFGETLKDEPKDDFFGTGAEEKESKESDFFGESQKSELKDDFFTSKEQSSEVNFFEERENLKSEQIKDENESGNIMDINLNEMNSKIDDVKRVSLSLKDDFQSLKDVDKSAINNINAEFEKVKGQIKSQSEEIKTNLDEVKSTIEKSREDIKLNISKLKVESDIKNEKEEVKEGKKSLLSKKASTDSLFRVIFFMIFITLGTVVYFGITIMEDLAKKGSSKVIERVIPAKLPANITASKIDTTKFENEAMAIRGEISNLNRSMNEFKNILNEIKNIKVTSQVTQMPVTIPTPTFTPISEVKKEIVREVKFDDSSINQKLNILSNEFDKISDKLNQINSKLSKVTNEVIYGKKELINKLDTVEKGLGYKIEARTPKPIKIYSDGLQIRDE